MDLAMSALPSEADVRAGLQDVCFVPISDSCTAAESPVRRSCADKLTTSRRFPVCPRRPTQARPADTSVARANDGGDRSLRPLQQQGREFIGHVEHHIMPACKLLPPPAALSCPGVKLDERTFKTTSQNVSDFCNVVAGAADLRRRFKAGHRVNRALTIHPS